MTEESIFIAALDKKSPAQRQAYLDEACQGQPALRAQVDELLRAQANAGSFMEHPPLGMDPTIVSDLSSRDTVQTADWSSMLGFLTPCNRPDRIGMLDQYEIIEVVGHGGMGAVMRAFDTKLSRVVAVKVMSPALASNPTSVKRFLREAMMAASIHHDHVVTIHAVNDTHKPPYLVMNFVEGQTLEQKIDREGALGLSHILRIGSQAAAGLAAAHKLGLIHRDVKPANILLENGVERVKISDFGLARAADDLQMTQTGIIAGTPQYMSPEQARGEPIDTRSDLFSLGSVLYTLCTGRPAFRADNPVAVLKRVCEDTPRPIPEINPEIPLWLDRIVTKLLAKDPNYRFQSAAEVSELLGQHLVHIQNPAVAPQPPDVVIRQPHTGLAGARRSRFATRPFWLATAAGIVLLLGLSLSEASGVTNLAVTIIRIATGQGTLVIESDDPNVKVAINGEDVTIHGTGVEEVRLRPGSYNLAASKDGKPVALNRELVTISRGGKQVVRVDLEPPAEMPLAEMPPSDKLSTDKSTQTAWQPPKNPDPSKILGEAKADASARRYELALQKHVWYHQHALEYGSGQTGVRLSFALMSWGQLCGNYPPALDKLLSLRDEAIATVKEGRKVFESFHDVVAINRTIDQEDVTRDLFAYLHAYHPADAKRVFAIAEPSLIKAKAYELCGKYLVPEEALKSSTRLRQLNKDLAPKMKDGGKSLLEHDERSFTNKMTTLVALLVVNGRKTEAEEVATDAKQEWNNARFHAKLDDALKGNVPEPWPPAHPQIRATKRPKVDLSSN